MVLDYLVDDIQQVVRMRPKRKLEELEAKGLPKAMLEGLSFMHEMGRAHSGTYVVGYLHCGAIEAPEFAKAGVQISSLITFLFITMTETPGSAITNPNYAT
jgi:hypothetical protein